ncbi:MAG: CBU_0592 family membrane protein [Syntrophomonadaceae bacterium]|nr:hypothetical protein [Bacillota bacterium]NLP24764.1 hypothetical protein [Syntrophomonadaceae bacterium]
MLQVISVIGAMLILLAFALSQIGKWNRRHPMYNLTNLVGSVLLAVIAVLEIQIGFILLEVTWAVLSAYALIKFRPDQA